jgi:hypothetical protein
MVNNNVGTSDDSTIVTDEFIPPDLALMLHDLGIPFIEYIG